MATAPTIAVLGGGIGGFPFFAQGAAQAIEDAAVLARAIRSWPTAGSTSSTPTFSEVAAR